MQDLHALYKLTNSKKCYGNFFRSTNFLTAYKYLTEVAKLPETEVLVKTHPTRNQPSKTLAHTIICLAFLQWCDEAAYYKALMKAMGKAQVQEAEEE